MGSRRNALGRIDVLMRDRDAVQRTLRPIGHDFRFGALGLLERAFARHFHEGMELAVEPVDPLEMRLHELDGRELALGDQGAGFGDCQHSRHRVVLRGAKTMALSAVSEGVPRTRSAIRATWP